VVSSFDCAFIFIFEFGWNDVVIVPTVESYSLQVSFSAWQILPRFFEVRHCQLWEFFTCF
jgi:hypothetical protein